MPQSLFATFTGARLSCLSRHAGKWKARRG